MSLVRFEQVSLEFGDVPLLSGVDFSLEPLERVCLVGRNGAGKSSMLKLITGALEPDQGEIIFQAHMRIAQLAQELPVDNSLTVRQTVMAGMAEQQRMLDAYARLSDQQLDAAGMRQLEDLQKQIDASGGWKIDQRVDAIISQLDLPASQVMSSLSGGWRRRVSLGQALVAQPDLLLLDEPTNHLDISTIEWLEHRIKGYRGAVLFISHDRAFVQRLATRVVELDRGNISSWPGTFQQFIRGRELKQREEERANAAFDKKLAEEEAWIRQGIKARRTRNEGRVRALKAMRAERAKRLARQGEARINISEAEQSGRKVIQARNLTHGFGGEPLIRDFSIKVMRGDRIGLIGNNGVGKSTLLRLLLGELEPDQGTIKFGTNLEIAYFDQLRRELDPTRTVAETVGNGQQYVTVNGKPRHVVGYMTDFLFSAKRAMSPVSVLSGGERNRVILAQLFTRPANVLVLDEPTNDLDVEMLEALEARLVEYDGTLIVTSHDREFLDNVVTSVLVFEDNGAVREYVGGYSDWARKHHELTQPDSPSERPLNDKPARVPGAEGRRATKLSYKLQRELDQLPARIETMETAIKELESAMAQSDFYAQTQTQMDSAFADLRALREDHEAAMERWIELEDR